MKLLLSGQSMRRIQFQRWGKRIGSSFSRSSSSFSSSSSSAPATIVVGRKRKGCALLGWCSTRSYVPKKWVYKFKAQWKKAIGWRPKSCTPPHYSYDIQSYALNFDEGGCR